MADRSKVLVVVLVLIIVVLAGIMIFTFLIKPKVTGYTTGIQIEGAQMLYLDIVKVVTQCQEYPLPIGNETIHLVALECLKSPAQAAQDAPVQ
jgi:SNF family Na+-dependent transporter